VVCCLVWLFVAWRGNRVACVVLRAAFGVARARPAVFFLCRWSVRHRLFDEAKVLAAPSDRGVFENSDAVGAVNVPVICDRGR